MFMNYQDLTNHFPWYIFHYLNLIKIEAKCRQETEAKPNRSFTAILIDTGYTRSFHVAKFYKLKIKQ